MLVDVKHQWRSWVLPRVWFIQGVTDNHARIPSGHGMSSLLLLVFLGGLHLRNWTENTRSPTDPVLEQLAPAQAEQWSSVDMALVTGVCMAISISECLLV